MYLTQATHNFIILFQFSTCFHSLSLHKHRIGCGKFNRIVLASKHTTHMQRAEWVHFIVELKHTFCVISTTSLKTAAAHTFTPIRCCVLGAAVCFPHLWQKLINESIEYNSLWAHIIIHYILCIQLEYFACWKHPIRRLTVSTGWEEKWSSFISNYMHSAHLYHSLSLARTKHIAYDSKWRFHRTPIARSITTHWNSLNRLGTTTDENMWYSSPIILGEPAFVWHYFCWL